MGTARRVGIAAGIAALVLVSACGRETKQEAVASAKPAFPNSFSGDPESAYCRVALEFSVMGMKADHSSVAGEEKYWNDYAAFWEQGTRVAPPEIKSAWQVYASNGLNKIMPVLRKYGFDEKRFMSEATEAEKNVMQDPPKFSEIVRYEWQVCGSGTPDAAMNVKFTGDKNSEFCKGEAELQEAFSKLPEGGFKPADVKAFFTSKELPDALDKKVQNAPDEIKEDVAASVNWIRTKQLPALAKWDYDFTKIKLQAPAADRFAIDMSALEIRDAVGRVNAYDSQVCGLE